MSASPDWIAVDWGTSHLRAWAMTADDAVLSRKESDDGMGRLAPAEFEPALLRLIETWLPDAGKIPVLACGMVGARQGWAEAAYRKVPCAAVEAGRFTSAPGTDRRIAVSIIPGLCQSDPPDVIRGEETQLAGFLSQTEFDGTICLPGTHTKWVTVRGNTVERFQTVMTGELFALLSEQSVLRHSIGDGWDQPAFLEAVHRANAKPAEAIASLFGVRARSLLQDADPAESRATLSGLLIGVELAAVDLNAGQLALIGSDGILEPYRTALGALGYGVVSVDSEAATLSGLIRAKAALEGN
ncbi:MAG: 2-dehydro-3-deoxygalactonokinase [Pseudomonadota bacterium]